MPCRPSPVEARARVLKMGKSIVFTTAELFQNDKLIAIATATNKLTDIIK